MNKLCKFCGNLLNTIAHPKSIYCSKSCFGASRRVFAEINTQNNLILGFRTCPKCKIDKPISDYSNKAKTGYCKACKTISQKIQRNILSNEQKLFLLNKRKEDRGKDYKAFIKYLYFGAKSSAKRRNVIFTLTLEALINKVEEQKLLCAITGESLTFITGNGLTYTNCSIDKIIPALGYIDTNIQLVSFRANIMKNTQSMSELYERCKKILVKAKNEGYI